ncbi:MAG: hypothetical protein VCE75_13730 [Alphaproteobacteria bacterium]
MLTVNVSSNCERLSRSLDQVGRKQLPFAFAKTLNETMKAVEKYTVARTYPRAFDVRNRAFFRAAMFTGSAIKRATKTKLRVSARDRFDRGNLQLHATGGTKRARSGRIAIPSRYVGSRRLKSGKVKPALLPRTVVNTPKGFIDRDGPREAIYQRYGRGGKQVRLLYVPHRSAKIRKRFRFYEYAERITRLVSPKLFRKNFSQAIRTARR